MHRTDQDVACDCFRIGISRVLLPFAARICRSQSADVHKLPPADRIVWRERRGLGQFLEVGTRNATSTISCTLLSFPWQITDLFINKANLLFQQRTKFNSWWESLFDQNEVILHSRDRFEFVKLLNLTRFSQYNVFLRSNYEHCSVFNVNSVTVLYCLKSIHDYKFLRWRWMGLMWQLIVYLKSTRLVCTIWLPDTAELTENSQRVRK